MHLQVSNVCKRFGHGPQAKLVLDQVSFDLHGGEFLALVGSSGSGKSTVMRLIAGLDRPTGGSISIDGQPVRRPGSDRGMVFQKYSLYPWLTAAENVAFGMELQQRPRQEIRERTAYFLEVVGLADVARSLPGNSREACSNGSPLPVPWPPSPRCCCSMSLLVRLTFRSVNPCRSFCISSGARPDSLLC